MRSHTYTAWDLEAFALDCGYAGPPFRWDEERRFLLRCELDAAYFHLYLGPPAEWGREVDGELGMVDGDVVDGGLGMVDGENNPQSTNHKPPLPQSTNHKSPLTEMFPTPRDAVDYIMETFPIVKRKDIKRTEIKNESGEVTAEGTYITKHTILKIYDELQQAIDTATPYQTRLDPPPGPPTDPEGNFIPATDWETSNWPSHIHPSRDVTTILLSADIRPDKSEELLSRMCANLPNGEIHEREDVIRLTLAQLGQTTDQDAQDLLNSVIDNAIESGVLEQSGTLIRVADD